MPLKRIPVSGPFACLGHGRCFRETFVSATVLHPSRREVHACARHGSHFFGGLRSFICNPLLFEFGTAHSGVFLKSQENTLAFSKMLCLHLKDVKCLYLLEEPEGYGNMVLYFLNVSLVRFMHCGFHPSDFPRRSVN